MNGIVLEKLSLGYKDIPKVACTSIKEAIYELQTGNVFDRKEAGTHIHQYYAKKKKDLAGVDFKFIVLRDPIKRFLSGYSNRVTHHNELSFEYLSNHKHSSAKILLDKGSILNPGIGQFIEFFDDYYQTPSIHHHLRPVTEILDGDLEFFNKIYILENIRELEEDISNLSKKIFKLPKSQTGGKKYSHKELNSQQMDYLIDFYKEDYKLMQDFYTIDDIWESWKK